MPLTPEQAAALGLDDAPAAQTLQVSGEQGGPAPSSRALSAQQASALGLDDAPATPTGRPDNARDQVETGLRHGAQGLASNFVDEIAGFIQAAGDIDRKGKALGPSYRAFRDQWRARDDALAKQYPVTAATSGVAGAVAQNFIPGVGAVTRVPGVGGAIAGLGASRADLTTGEAGNFGKAALHTGLGAGADLALAVTGKYIAAPAFRAVANNAPARQVGRAVADWITQIPPKTVLDPNLAKLGGRAAIPKALGDEGIDILAGPQAVKAGLDGVKKDVGRQLGGYYDRVASRSEGKTLAEVIEPMETLANQAHAKGRTQVETAIRSEIAKTKSLYEADGHLNANQLHGMTQEFAEKGWEGARFLSRKQSVQTSRDLANVTRTLLQQHVDDVTRAHPDVGSLAELRSLNERFSKVSALSAIADAKTKALERPSLPLAKRIAEGVNFAHAGMGAVGAAGAMMAGEPTLAGGLLAAGLGARAIPHMASAVDAGLIRVARLAREGGRKVEVLQLATKLGIPREIAVQLIETEDQARAQEAAYAPR